jgi:hypothetical protein
MCRHSAVDVVGERRVEACEAGRAGLLVGVQRASQHGDAGVALAVLVLQPLDNRHGFGAAQAQAGEEVLVSLG